MQLFGCVLWGAHRAHFSCPPLPWLYGEGRRGRLVFPSPCGGGLRGGVAACGELFFCHPERSEGSGLGTRSFAALRMTVVKPCGVRLRAACAFPAAEPWVSP